MAENINNLNVDLPAAPDGYFWVTGSELHDYYLVYYVELRKSKKFGFSKLVGWDGYRDIQFPFNTLRVSAENMLSRLGD